MSIESSSARTSPPAISSQPGASGSLSCGSENALATVSRRSAPAGNPSVPAVYTISKETGSLGGTRQGDSVERPAWLRDRPQRHCSAAARSPRNWMSVCGVSTTQASLASTAAKPYTRSVVNPVGQISSGPLSIKPKSSQHGSLSDVPTTASCWVPIRIDGSRADVRSHRRRGTFRTGGNHRTMSTKSLPL